MIDREEGARLGIVHADGRVFLNRTEQRFDAVVMDAFSSGSVPAHLATRETYARLRDIVDGPVYVNLIDAPDGPLARGIHAILSELYPHVQQSRVRSATVGWPTSCWRQRTRRLARGRLSGGIRSGPVGGGTRLHR